MKLFHINPSLKIWRQNSMTLIISWWVPFKVYFAPLRKTAQFWMSSIFPCQRKRWEGNYSALILLPGIAPREQWVAHSPKPPPLAYFWWGLAATTSALSWWHIDSEGFGTYIDTKAGLKWWIVAWRKGKEHEFESFSEADIFFNRGYELDEPNLDKWDMEAVVLHPGTQLWVVDFFS